LDQIFVFIVPMAITAHVLTSTTRANFKIAPVQMKLANNDITITAGPLEHPIPITGTRLLSQEGTSEPVALLLSETHTPIALPAE